MLKEDEKYFLPRVYCYFDDTIGSETELLNDYTGQRLAINEFNSSNNDIKLAIPYHLITDGNRDPLPYHLITNGNKVWQHQMWICHFFKHHQYNAFISKPEQQLTIDSLPRWHF